MGSPIVETWVNTTVLIRNEWNRIGTGFLVAREIAPDQGQILLVTNKHVIHKDEAMRRQASRITITANITEPDGKIRRKEFPLPMAGRPWGEHVDADVDVLVIEVTDLILAHPEMHRKWAMYGDFADQKVLEEQEITIGEEVFIIGYPLGLSQGESCFPLVRQGVIATRIGENVREVKADGSVTVLPAFRVDGGIVPGSSGSPVVLKPVFGRVVKGKIELRTALPCLLGIVATTHTTYVEQGTQRFQTLAGLGLAFDAATIKDTIESFF